MRTFALAANHSKCIGREPELTLLEEAFRETLLGNGRVMSITGHSGTGKSTLLHEFMDRSKRSEKDLVSAWGLCDSQVSNIPLLPWKELLESLAGVSQVEVAVDIKPGKGVFESTRSAVVELAPDLIDLLVPGIGLVMRATKMLSQRTALGTRLLSNRSRDQLVERKVLDADKSLLQEQYISLLERLSEDTPLILIIEDLHWADHASFDMLKRLVARVCSA